MANWQNKTLFVGDNLHVMRGMDSQTVDLIYLDPPFNSNRTYSAPIGSQAAGAAFKDAWTLLDVDLVEHQALKQDHPGLFAVIDAAGSAHSKSMKSYLIMMAVRLLEMRRLLKDTGSLYLHCDPTASHYLKLALDALFGCENFRNEITWCYRKWSVAAGQFARNHDVILFYSRNPASERPFNVQYIEPSPGTLKRWKGKRQLKVFENGIPKATSTSGKASTPCPDWWDISVINPNARERVGFPTQKPLALLDRILAASSNKGDVVLDPFCGCATTLVAADREDRQWVGIDLSPKAGQLVQERIEDDQGHLFPDLHVREDVPRRTDLGPPLKTAEKREYKRILYGLQVGRCNGCNVHFERLEHFHMDHIVARARGGTDHKWNFQLLCGHCNSIKGTKTQAEFAAIISQQRKDFSWM